MYKNVEEFLQDTNPVEYDFKNEIEVADKAEPIKKELAKKVRDEKDSIKKFLLYKETGEKDKKIVFDCDSCDGSCSLTNKIYDILWGWHYDDKSKKRDAPDKLIAKLDECWKAYGLGSDTMNSFKTTYTRAQKIYKESSDTYYGEANNNPYIQQFARLTHSIGNFTIIPFKLKGAPFNPCRGYSKSEHKNILFVNDYWDLSLKLVKEELGDAAFKSYINTFFLNDYVDDDYNILPLIKRHEDFLAREKLLPLESGKSAEVFLPQNETELNEYLKNVICKIKLRGIIMIHEIKTKRSIT